MHPRLKLVASPSSQQIPRWRILLVGEHRTLLRALADVLMHTDAAVVYCHPSDLDGQSNEGFDLAVLCHTLPRQQAVSIAAEARARWRQIRILHISRFSFGLLPIPSHADAVAGCGKTLELYTTAMGLLGETEQGKTLEASDLSTHIFGAAG
jgi:hypothetical protein